ncbi:TonB-dependent receptor [Colwellia sp. MEBiC06753]
MKINYLATHVAIALSLTAFNASAEEATPKKQIDRTKLEVIEVRSQKRVQNQQEVPIAMTAVSAADIERIGATEVKDIQFSTPNFTVAGTNPVQQSFGLRGISDRGRNAGYDQRIGVYVDGVWVGKSAASNQSALDVETVEILRGPQGTLFGKNTVAGSINITTKRPHEDFAGFIQAEAGNYGKKKIKGAVNAPITDNFMGKFSISSDQRDGYVKNIAGKGIGSSEYNTKDELAYRGQLLWEAGANTEVMLTVDHLENDFIDVAAGENPNDPIAPDIYEVSIDGKQRFIIDGVGGTSLNITHTFDNNFELTSISAYRYEDWSFNEYDEDSRR